MGRFDANPNQHYLDAIRDLNLP